MGAGLNHCLCLLSFSFWRFRGGQHLRSTSIVMAVRRVTMGLLLVLLVVLLALHVPWCLCCPREHIIFNHLAIKLRCGQQQFMNGPARQPCPPLVWRRGLGLCCLPGWCLSTAFVAKIGARQAARFTASVADACVIKRKGSLVTAGTRSSTYQRLSAASCLPVSTNLKVRVCNVEEEQAHTL